MAECEQVSARISLRFRVGSYHFVCQHFGLDVPFCAL